MKKVILIILLLLCAGSIGFGVYNYLEYTSFEKKIDKLKNEISEMKASIKDEEKLKKETQEKYDKFIADNKDKIEEIKKWEEEVKKVKDLL